LNSTDLDKNSLSERQLKALPLFASCLTYEEACRRAEIDRSTFYNWLKDPLFKTELNRLRDSIIEEAVSILKTSATESVGKLLNLMRSGSTEGIQRAAANDLLGHLAKYKQIEEIEDRICALEALAAAAKKGRTADNR